jgi:pimeloyl-ACP methyl ester carboxylesterase
LETLDVRTRQIRLRAYRWPNPGRPAVLLLHGMSGCAPLWREVAERLAAEYEVIAPDLRGHGMSEKPDGPYTAEAMAADNLALMESLGIDRAALIGHSLGARVAWYVAFAAPKRITRLVVEDQFPDSRTDAAAYWQQSLGDWPVRFSSREEAVDFLRRRGRTTAWWEPSIIQAEDGSWTWGFRLETLLRISRETAARDDWPVVIRLRCPVLVIRGGASTHLTAETADLMAATIARCRLVTVDGADHWVHGQQPEAWLEAVRPFLAGSRTRRR